MKVGDMNISRENMPSFPLSQLNPDHIEQAFQDVLTRNLPPVYQGMGAPVASDPSQTQQQGVM